MGDPNIANGLTNSVSLCCESLLVSLTLENGKVTTLSITLFAIDNALHVLHRI